MFWDAKEYEFEPAARAALERARVEAVGLHHDYVGTEHLLLGLIFDDLSNTAIVLAGFGVSVDDVRRRVLDSVRKGKALISLGDLPFTSRSKRSLQLAMEEARAGQATGATGWHRRRSTKVGEVHLMIGLLREQKGLASVVLTSFGIVLPELREAFARVADPDAAAEGETAQPPEADEPTFHVTIDDSSDNSIYEQIIQRIQEAVATGELAPGTRLPTVRRMADDLDVAPGTVARAYGALEKLGVVVTEGARGTRVAQRESASRSGRVSQETLAGLLRPVAVAAYHLGADADSLRSALDTAMQDIYE